MSAVAVVAQVPPPAPAAAPAQVTAPAPAAVPAPAPPVWTGGERAQNKVIVSPFGNGIGSGYGYGYSFGKTGEDPQYQAGQHALDNHRWDDAVKAFTDVASHGGSHADGALYWKAYALNKLGRRDEALGAIADLRKSFPMSRWLEDAQALEMQVKAAAGQPVAPENQSDEELKLLALNGLMHSEPDRALPLIENLLKGTQSPQLKKNALYVIAQNGSARAQQVLEQIARGSGSNPDLQVVAIRYYAQQRKNQNTGQVLTEIYNGSTDPNVKREALDALVAQQNAKALVAIARAERDAELKKSIVRSLANVKSPDATEYLLELLK